MPLTDQDRLRAIAGSWEMMRAGHSTPAETMDLVLMLATADELELPPTVITFLVQVHEQAEAKRLVEVQDGFAAPVAEA